MLLHCPLTTLHVIVYHHLFVPLSIAPIIKLSLPHLLPSALLCTERVLNPAMLLRHALFFVEVFCFVAWWKIPEILAQKIGQLNQNKSQPPNIFWLHQIECDKNSRSSGSFSSIKKRPQTFIRLEDHYIIFWKILTQSILISRRMTAIIDRLESLTSIFITLKSGNFINSSSCH